MWFKLFLYELTGNGPVSLLLPKGYRLNSLPESFLLFDKFMVITWGHDPVFIPHYNLLSNLLKHLFNLFKNVSYFYL